MKACRTASVVAMFPLVAVAAFGACRGAPPVDVPPPTTAPATSAIPILSTPATSSSTSSSSSAPDASAAPRIAPATTPAPDVRIIDAPTKLAEGLCTTTLLAVVKGSFTVMKEKLGPGDVVVVPHAYETPVEGTGLAVEARTKIMPCPILDRPVPTATVIRASAAPALTWAKGTMTAHLDVNKRVSPDLYLGRLEGSAPVAEHTHPTSWEILVAVEAAGSFVVDGRSSRLGPRGIVMVPPGAKHAWTPDPGSKLVAIQMYAPPGPEERFIALAASEKDAGR